jgi:hypothetical protein
MINSELFTEIDGKMIRRHYSNLRLLTGFNVKNESSYTPDEVASQINAMCDSISWVKHSIPYVTSVYKWKGRFTPNWFLPVHLGGLGINPKYGSTLRITKEQRQVARYFVAEPATALFRTSRIPLKTCKFLQTVKSIGLKLVPECDAQDFHFLKNKGSVESLLQQVNLVVQLENISEQRPDISCSVKVFMRNVHKAAVKWGSPMSNEGLDKYWYSHVHKGSERRGIGNNIFRGPQRYKFIEGPGLKHVQGSAEFYHPFYSK